jgi:iron complex outermembrane receptor protein
MSSTSFVRCLVRGAFLCAVLSAGAGLGTPASASPVRDSGTQAPAVTITGTVRDADGKALPGAVVEFGTQRVVADAAGAWTVSVPTGRVELRVSLDGFESVRRAIDVATAMGRIEITLLPPLRLREDIVVTAVRAGERDPVTKTDIGAELIGEVNRGQEMPFLLSRAPSVNVQSDSGAAAGYAYFNIRGVGQTRLNVTLDGVPLQDSEDQALYFSNFGDFASVVDSVQVQRGVGTSSVGAASYGGSVNFASVNPAESFRFDAQGGGGSWGTGRGTAALHSGRVGGGLAFYLRGSAQTSDGFRDHSGADQGTVYYGATQQGSRSMFKVFGFSGRTKTQLAYLATDEATLAQHLRTNTMSPDERDDFGQDVVQAQFTRLVGSSSTVMAQAYYNGAQGWFRIYDTPREHLQQYGINGQLVGVVLGATREQGRLSLNWGAHANTFARDHFMDVVGGDRAYLNTGRKRELNTFLKATWKAGPATAWADAQVRHARFEYDGTQPLGSVSWTFFNPKAGVRVAAAPSLTFYASAGRMSREPARSDLLFGEDNATLPYDLHAVKPERVVDVEAGGEFARHSVTLKANVYAMEFRDEIALTGELSDIGLPTRRNVGRSSRRGVEVEAAWHPAPALRLSGTATVSRNRIAAWTQFYDVYDTDFAWIDSVARVAKDVQPLLTPPVLLNGEVSWTPVPHVGVDVSGRWVSRSQLDNTGDADYRTPSFFTLDGQVTLTLFEGRQGGRGESTLRIQGVNLLDQRRAWPGGYSYQYLMRDNAGADTLAGTAYYYPLATRSVYVTLAVRF